MPQELCCFVRFAILTAIAAYPVVHAATEPSIVLREDLEQSPSLQADYDVCEEAGKQNCPVSRIYLQTSSAKIGLAVTNRLYALIAMPHPNPEKSKTFEVTVTLVTPTPNAPGRFKRPYLAVDLSETEAAALTSYLADLPVGGRFEPILEIKNLIVGDAETTSVSVVPVGLTLDYDPDTSVFLNGLVGYRAVYVPHWTDPEIGDGARWTATHASATGSVVVCGAQFKNNHAARTPNAFTIAIQGLGDEGLGDISFKPPTSRRPLAPLAPSGAAPTALKAQTKISSRATEAAPKGPYYLPYKFNRQARTGRPLSFRFGAPVVVTDYPVYLRAELNSSAESKNGRSNVFGIDFNFNFNGDKDAPGPFKAISIAGVSNLTLAPAIKLKMTNVLNADNENSLRWWLPIAWNKPFRAQCAGKTPCANGLCCTTPFLRSLSLTAGLSGEHSAYNQNQKIVVPIGTIWRFRSLNAAARKDWNISLDIFAGAQAGRTIDKTTTAYVATSDGSRSIVFRPREETGILRFHGQTKLNIGLGKNRSLNFTWDRWHLLRQEQFLAAQTVNGSFSAARPDFLPEGFPWEPVNQKLTYFIPDVRKGFRHYWSGKFTWEVVPSVSFDASYFRGELPPAFQYVDKFTIGIAYQIK